MNEVVRYVKAGTLPEELREGIDPEATVRVEVRAETPAPSDEASDPYPRDASGRIDLPAMLRIKRSRMTVEELKALFDRLQERLRDDPSLIERDPVRRVREARYGEE